MLNIHAFYWLFTIRWQSINIRLQNTAINELPYLLNHNRQREIKLTIIRYLNEKNDKIVHRRLSLLYKHALVQELDTHYFFTSHSFHMTLRTILYLPAQNTPGTILLIISTLMFFSNFTLLIQPWNWKKNKNT